MSNVRGRGILLGFAVALAASGGLVGIVFTFGARLPPAAANTRDVKSGEALYLRYCAVCHGDAGRGDGSSATGFATKPADLTDGRLMNTLPDEFLVNIILRGGPAEGLSPGMPPFADFLSESQTRQLIRYLRAIAAPPFRPEMAKPLVTFAKAPRQPILFSHVAHAGSFQISCQYCHADARRSEYAGLPSVERCMGCHRIIGAQDNPEIATLPSSGCASLAPTPGRGWWTTSCVCWASGPRREPSRWAGASTATASRTRPAALTRPSIASVATTDATAWAEPDEHAASAPLMSVASGLSGNASN